MLLTDEHPSIVYINVSYFHIGVKIILTRQNKVCHNPSQKYDKICSRENKLQPKIRLFEYYLNVSLWVKKGKKTTERRRRRWEREVGQTVSKKIPLSFGPSRPALSSSPSKCLSRLVGEISTFGKDTSLSAVDFPPQISAVESSQVAEMASLFPQRRGRRVFKLSK